MLLLSKGDITLKQLFRAHRGLRLHLFEISNGGDFMPFQIAVSSFGVGNVPSSAINPEWHLTGYL